jgi:hypothetical protein
MHAGADDTWVRISNDLLTLVQHLKPQNAFDILLSTAGIVAARHYNGHPDALDEHVLEVFHHAFLANLKEVMGPQ